MLINAQNLDLVFRGFNTAFNKGSEAAKPHHPRVSMTVPSSSSEENYGWLADIPRMREWVGDRVVKNLAAHGYSIVNKRYENTISVARTTIEDDKYGIFAPMVREMGQQTAEHPDELVFSLLASGFTTPCYDGQYFFDTDHPVKQADGSVASVANMQAGAGPAWFLLDTTRAIKPLIWQPRTKYTPQHLDKDTDANVFWRDEYIYGVRARGNAGFGLWQLAYASKAELTAENYETARQAMMSLKGDEGRPLNIKPDVLVVPPALEGAALRLVNNGMRVVYVDNGGTPTPVPLQNEWKDTAEPIVTGWL